ncbi:hypothetical protein O7635_22295 [Asanoa sp. WMMD1127]|uniref:hypothetical protein n=1 Tax=Asanoa sp. WMMD1127 TaxID=3016107 RepID=UPI0024177109|nr:hypothetical protein [Asanoa sp. WMMD1127]MDG4824589.1 hypothetical protein [Asanoa sp. WMMD1127]
MRKLWCALAAALVAGLLVAGPAAARPVSAEAARGTVHISMTTAPPGGTPAAAPEVTMADSVRDARLAATLLRDGTFVRRALIAAGILMLVGAVVLCLVIAGVLRHVRR